MLGRMILPGSKLQIQWPPYVPPYIAILRDWMRPGEIVASDMPWAVAWYADRKSVWLPETPAALLQMSDYRELGGQVPALYLTPISGTENTLGRPHQRRIQKLDSLHRQDGRSRSRLPTIGEPSWACPSAFFMRIGTGVRPLLPEQGHEREPLS